MIHYSPSLVLIKYCRHTGLWECSEKSGRIAAEAELTAAEAAKTAAEAALAAAIADKAAAEAAKTAAEAA